MLQIEVLANLFGFVAFLLHFVPEHLETVEALFVHFARLALGTKIPVTRGQFVDTAIQLCVALTGCAFAGLHA